VINLSEAHQSAINSWQADLVATQTVQNNSMCIQPVGREICNLSVIPAEQVAYPFKPSLSALFAINYVTCKECARLFERKISYICRGIYFYRALLERTHRAVQ